MRSSIWEVITIIDINLRKIFNSRKFCIFCGKNPVEKTVEHIIPQWLIELTGDPKREINLSLILSKEGNSFAHKNFSFNKFVFPACNKCNNRYGELENLAKPIVISILKSKEVSPGEFTIFFDWLDKIRVGLWLAYYYLNSNMLGIDPNYFIENRIGLYDRLVFIYKSNYRHKRITFSGINTLAFQYNPTCFSIAINDFHFFNISAHSYLARRLGFPHVSKFYYTETSVFKGDMKEGSKRIREPLLRSHYLKGATELFQPIYKTEIAQFPEFYKNEYLEKNSLENNSGTGKIFYSRGQKISIYPEGRNDDWRPTKIFDERKLSLQLATQVLNYQTMFLRNLPSRENVSLERKKQINLETNFAIKINNKLIDFIENGGK